MDVHLGFLLGLLVVLLLLSAFFSGTETALMSLNRYRLRHRANSGQRSARIAEQLLQRPDRLLGLILLGNNACNLAAASLVTVISLQIGGEQTALVGTLILTFVVLIFSEVAPKTVGALHPNRIAPPAALIYYPLLKVLSPVVWFISFFANGVLRILGIQPDTAVTHSLNAEELRTAVADSGILVPRRHQRMLLSILDLDSVTVDDLMVTRQDIQGIDLDRPWEHNATIIHQGDYGRFPVYRDDIDNMIGIVELRSLLPYLADGTLDEQRLTENIREPHFVPEGTPLNKQLLNFQQMQRRSAFVVDEYGDIQGLITIEDVLREIVGEFDAEPAAADLGITRESDTSFVIDAGANIRRINRLMGWSLPTDGPKTLNGVIVEQLETIPAAGTQLTIADHPMEILSTSEHGIKQVRIHPPDSLPVDEPFSASV